MVEQGTRTKSKFEMQFLDVRNFTCYFVSLSLVFPTTE